jgi:hypothetical protein
VVIVRAMFVFQARGSGRGLAVLPTDIVYRREAGVAPFMPPCGRR